jgi:outer membrane protein TolC
MNVMQRESSRRAASAARIIFGTVAVLLVPGLARAQDRAPAPPVRLTLGEAARLAASQSAVAQGAQLRTEQARARVTQRRADLLPSLSASALQSGRTFNTVTFGISFPTPPGQAPFFNPEGQVEGPVNTIDLRGRVQANVLDLSALARVRTAQTSVSAASAEAANAANEAATIAASAYLRALRGVAQFAARLADSTLATELLSIARSQLQAGVGVGLDVTRAQAQLATTHAQLIAARNERDRADLELHRALNVSIDTPIELSDSLSADVLDDLALDERTATLRALRDRADLRAAQEQLRVAQQSISAIRSERLPSVSAFGDDGVIGKDLGRVLPTYTYGIQLSVPVFDGFRREGRIEEQQAVARELDVRRRDLELRTTIEVRGALLDLASAREAVDAARQRLRLSEQEVAQARERFRAGVAGNADVVTASFSLNTARSQYVDALTALQSSRVALAHAEGAVTRLR